VKRNIGRLEAQLLAYTQMRGWTTVRTGDLRTPMRLSADQERKLFSRLARAGMIARVWRGLYLVPPRLPLGGKWSPDEGLALATLMAARGGRYQICGLNAFNRYGFDEQMPNRVYAYNNRISGDRRIGSVQLTLIKVADARSWSDRGGRQYGGRPTGNLLLARPVPGRLRLRLVPLREPPAGIPLDPERDRGEASQGGGSRQAHAALR